MTTEIDIANLKTLVVDDQMLSRKQLEQGLKSIGITAIDQAATVPEALEKIAVNTYDVIFLDWYMPPGKSGYQLLQQLRENRAYDAVACIIVSAEVGQSFISEAHKIGATAYLIKPATERMLRAEMEKTLVWLSQRRNLQK